MWDFIIYLKCCKYDGCRVASRCCSRLVLRCESDSDLDSRDKTTERCILCKLSPGINGSSWDRVKIRWLSENSECYFLNLSNIRQPGAENPPDITWFRNRGRVIGRQNPPGSMAVKVFGRFLKNRDLRENVSPFPFPFFPSFFFLLLSLFFLFQSVKILRSSILWRVAEIVENKFLHKNIKNKGKKNTHKSGARYTHKFIFLLYVCTCTRYYVARKHRITSHGSQAKQKR